MSPFSYRATTLEGKIVEGVMEADGQAAVIANLRSQGYIPLEVESGAKKLGGSRRFSFEMPKFGGRVKNRDLMLFTRELATLLRAGMPLDRSLQSLGALTENEKLKNTVASVLDHVQAGKSLSEALDEHDDVFPVLYVNMVKAGEVGGVIETVLERLAEYLESAEKTRDEVKSAMAYPIVLGFVGSAAITVLLTYVLPKFAMVFADLGSAMPPSTRFVMAVSELLQSYWWVGVLLLAAMWISFKRYTGTPSGRFKFDRFRLQVPLFGELTTKVQIAAFARTLGTMLKSGVPLLQSLEIVRAVVSNTVISMALESVQKDVSEGKGLSGPLERTGVFPSLSLQMVSVGEETGRLDDMLLVVSDHYDRDVTNTLSRLMSLLEPGMLLVMGVVVAFIVIAMLSAVFSVNDMAF
jgi:general secretion pathway protein F